MTDNETHQLWDALAAGSTYDTNWQTLKRPLKDFATQADWAGLCELFQRSVSVDLSQAQLNFFCKLLRKHPTSTATLPNTVPIRIYGSRSFEWLAELIQLFLARSETPARIMIDEFGGYEQTLRFGNLPNDAHLALMLFEQEDLRCCPHTGATSEDAEQAAQAEIERIQQLWSLARDSGASTIVQNTFVTEPGVFGSLSSYQPGTLQYHTRSVNTRLHSLAQQHSWLCLHDHEILTSTHGRKHWYDKRYYSQAKLPCTPEALKHYAQSLASLINAQYGKARKCLALDLDNTLWGGVAAESEPIDLAQGDAIGETFIAFQQHCKQLKESGILLAIVSKNEHDFVEQLFKTHPDMILQWNDFSAFQINWNDKASNLKQLAETLNIGLDSLVFFDDNPAERTQVRRFLPSVLVPNVPADAADYINALQQHHPFERIAFTSEDQMRTNQYRAEAQRKQSQQLYVDKDAYLKSLEMVAQVEPLTEQNLARVTQLINKTNQFNLTTKRRTEAQVRELMDSADWLTLCVRLKDKFGDHGLIAVLLAKCEQDTAHIDTWLMSCRVFQRTVEHFTLCALFNQALSRNLKQLKGYYSPTKKNHPFATIYEQLGFMPTSTQPDKGTEWVLPLDVSPPSIKHSIQQTTSLP